MRIFVTGASGYIGHAVARALRRAGHDVRGLVRSAEKAAALEREEVAAVMGDMAKPATYDAALDDCTVFVHAAVDYGAGVVGPDRIAIETLLAAAARGAGPKTVLYTSGVWVHGDTGDRVADESTPLAPARAVAWRPAHERLVLETRGVRSIVIRPGCVYGLTAGLTASWFESAEKEGAVRAVGTGGNRWAMVHVHDLADAYVRAAESGLEGEVFDVADRSRSTVREMAEAAAGAAGKPGAVRFVPMEEAAKAMGDMAQALALDQQVDARKAVRLLGWQPRHGGFVAGVERYYAAWKGWRDSTRD